MLRNSAAFRIFVALLALWAVAPALSLAAHDIPSDATVQMFLKPAGNRLNILVRVPLKTMRDVEFPEREKGYLDFDRVDPTLREAASLWVSDFIDVYEGDALLPKPRVVETRLSLDSDPSFASYDLAVAHVMGPKLTNGTTIFWDQLMLDVLFEYPIQSDQSRFSIHPALDRLANRVVIALRFLPPGGAVRAFEFLGDPGLIRLDPRWFQAAGQFVKLGFFHILDGTDHLLFLFCLVIPFRRFGALIPVVTAFTVAHSITLIASAYNLAPDALWFPPLIETLIATSIVYMALENIVGGATVQRRWMITFGFGLVHGFGFSFALRQTMQFAGSHLLDLTAFVQYRRRAWTTPRPRADDPRLGASLPLRGGRADGHDHTLGNCGAYGVALDDRPLPGAAPVSNSLAGAGGSSPGESPALADVDRDRGRPGLAGIWPCLASNCACRERPGSADALRIGINSGRGLFRRLQNCNSIGATTQRPAKSVGRAVQKHSALPQGKYIHKSLKANVPLPENSQRFPEASAHLAPPSRLAGILVGAS